MVASEDGALETAALSQAIGRQNKDEEEKEKQQMMELLESQKQVLGEPCRSLLDLRDGQEKSYAQIADALKVPMGTVMSRLARCKEALKTLVLKALKETSRGR